MFVVPYLKDNVETPVMFCGVNAEPERYGYPASNVSGILERDNIRESIVFAQQIVPEIQTIGYIGKDSPTAQAAMERIQDDSERFPAETVGFKLPKTMQEAVAMTQELKDQADALFIMAALEGLLDEQGNPLPEKTIIPVLAETFGKPLVGIVANHVASGALCAVIQSGQEQGRTAATMLLQAMQGTPVSEIPITRNQYGQRIINRDTMKALNIKPRGNFLRGTELIRTAR
jgi:ABC-type uncharacterized transport system substrate-binding protein